MPRYTYEHRETGEVIELLQKIAEMEQFVIDHPEYLKIIVDAPMNIVPERLGMPKVPSDFREGVLGRINKMHDKAKFNKQFNDKNRRGSRFNDNITMV